MEREHRYWVAKTKDVEKYLSEEQQLSLDRFLTKIRIGRLKDGKADVKTVCVDSDWPEYETVWRMIEARVDGKASPASVSEVTDGMAIAFHRALADGEIGQSEVDEIKTGLRAALDAAPTPPVILSDADVEIERLSNLLSATEAHVEWNKLKAVIATKDAEIERLKDCREIDAMIADEHRHTIEQQAESISSLELLAKTQSEYGVFLKTELGEHIAKQSAALKLAREALFDMQDSYAAVHGWKDSFVIAATTAIAAIDSLQKGE